MSWRLCKWRHLYERITSAGPLQVLKTTITMPFYAVARGRTPGIFQTWADCESQVKGFSGARYKKFDSVVEAQNFIDTHGGDKSQKTASSSASQKTATSSFNHSTLLKPSTSNGPSILKRPFSTSNQRHSSENGPSKPKKKKTKSKKGSSDSDSDDSDDLSTIIVKQMDDLEKRLKSFEKGIDKIIKKSTKTDRKAIMIEPQSIGRASSVNYFETDNDGFVQVYTDGACSANGRYGAKAGLGVYWGEGHSLNVSEPVSGRATNNCGEIQAATRAIQLAIDNGIDKLAIYTDSKFLINSVTKWMDG